MDDVLFPDLAAEQEWLEHARRCRVAMIERLRPLLGDGVAADEFTDAYVRFTAERQLDDLADDSAADFFGRIDFTETDRFHIGRRHIDDVRHEPVVVDWRAAIAAPFYRATVHDALGLLRRRRFSLDRGRLTAYQDDRFDDPDAVSAGGIPDPLLAEMGSARTGEMREIVATIQAEQDLVIRSELEACLIVQGGPGTGKTAVGLHRAAFLLFEHRRRLSDEGVLVVGPNRVFLDYIAHVLPSLGERSVQQRTIADLATPRVPVDAVDDDAVARLKGDARMAEVLARAAASMISPLKDTVRVGVGSRTVVVTPELVQEWLDAALDSRQPLHRRRLAFRSLAWQELGRLAPGGVEAARRSSALRAVLDQAWPTGSARALVDRVLANAEILGAAANGILSATEQELLLATRRRRRKWTAADLALLDEATGILDGPPATYGHIVVDEAQDLSEMALRMLARRSRTGSFTVLGDLAQSTAVAGHTSWDVVAAALSSSAPCIVEHLSIGYRVPGPLLDVANRLLPLTAVDVPASRSARVRGEPPRIRIAHDLAGAVAATIRDDRREHALVGVVVPRGKSATVVRDGLVSNGLVPVSRLTDLGADDVPFFVAEDVKGLEFDAVIVVNPHELLDGSPIGARLLYVAMTRAVQRLTFVADRAVPALLVA